MRPGLVVNIRVNPKDCLSVLDVMDIAGIPTKDMSFARMVSLALSSLLETARLAGQIDERTGFEFETMMQPFIGQKRTKRKLEIAQRIHLQGSSIKAPVLPVELPAPVVHFAPPVVEELTTEMRLARRDLTALVMKKDMADDKVPGIFWSKTDAADYEQLVKAVYPDG